MNNISNRIDKRYELFRHPGGETHFELAGQGHGELGVFVPGATLPLAVWDPSSRRWSQPRVPRYSAGPDVQRFIRELLEFALSRPDSHRSRA
ncbi:MAG: hypothetical protein WAU39_00430 [Polyangiales bacterium]